MVEKNNRSFLRVIKPEVDFKKGTEPLGQDLHSHALENLQVHYVDVSEYPCLEIDFIEDLESARELFKS